MKKNIAIILIIIQISLSLGIPVGAYKSTDITIKLLSDKNVFSSKFETELEIDFLNKDLYNKNVYASYHIYDKNGNEILFEGLRLPILIDSSYKAKVKFIFDLEKAVNIDSSQIIDVKNNKYLRIKFDIVDQENLYWYSKNKDINFSTCEVVYENSFIKKFNYINLNAFRTHPFIFILNILIFIISICFIIRIRKNFKS